MDSGPDHFILPDWPAPPQVRALQTTRLGGISQPPYGSFNLGDHVGDDPAAVAANRARLAAFLPAPPLWLKQVHGTAVADADLAGRDMSEGMAALPAGDAVAPGGEIQPVPMAASLRGEAATPGGEGAVSGIEADAAIARRPGRVCAVMTADCLPVLLCDRDGSVVAAAHAGWRGLAAGVIEATVAAMDRPAGEILAWLGPAIGPEAFEVGNEVRASFIDHDSQAADAFTAHGEGKWLADLWLLARQRLDSLGIRAVWGGGQCTVTGEERFFSYRRDGATGRMASLIWLADHPA